MSTLRTQMTHDMIVRGFTKATQKSSLRAVTDLAQFAQQFPLITCWSYTTYVGGRLSEHFDHPFLSFEAPCTIRTDTIPGGKQVHCAVQA